MSGFHSPLEQQVLHSLLRRQGRAIMHDDMRHGRHPIRARRGRAAVGYMLILMPLASSVTRTTCATSPTRNWLVLALAAEVVIPHITDGSWRTALIEAHRYG